ncbi:MAG: PAS domain S-box protein [Pseudomonadota bacterium]
MAQGSRAKSSTTGKAPAKRQTTKRSTAGKTKQESPILEQAITAVVSIDENNLVTFYNKSAELLWGYSAEEVIGRNVAMLVPPEMQSQHDSMVDANRTTGIDKIVGTSREVPVHRKDGSLRYGRLSLSKVPVGKKITYTAFVEDVTDQVQQREELQQIFAQAVDAVVSIDEQNIVTRFNPAAERLWGYDADEVLGKNVSMLVPPEMQSRHDGFVNANRTTGVDKIVGTSREVQFPRKDGTQVWGKLSLSRVKVGDSITYTAFVQDVTAEVERREEIKVLSLVANETSNSVVITDPLGRIEYVNPGFYNMTGYTLDDVVGKKPGDVLQGPLTDQDTVTRIRHALESRKPFYEEILNYRRDGSSYWISLAVNPVCNEQGEIYKFVSVQALIDETKRQQLEYTNKINAISRSQAVIEFTPEGKILGCNDNFERASGFSSEELIGKHHRMLVAAEEQATPEYQSLWNRLAAGEPYVAKIKRMTKSGDPMYLQASYNPIQDAEGKVYMVVKYASDVTELEREALMVADVLSESRQVMEAVAEGDLTQTVNGHFEGDCAVLQNAINSSVGKLRATLEQIVESSRNMGLSAQTVSQGNLSLSQRTENQAATLEETAASMEEMTSTIRSNAENLREADSLAEVAREKADTGGSVVAQAVHAMDEINDASKKIADIIGVIDEIAFQTNLLALNAAVEAARAGEQGRGFAVVATEVRNLAQRSAGAAKEIKELIKDSVTKVDEGSLLVNRSGETLTEIVASVQRVNEIIGRISVASQEQAEGVDQVNQAVSNMDQMTQKNAALAEEATSASMNMSSESESLNHLIGVFQLGQELEPQPSPAEFRAQPTPQPAATQAAPVQRPVPGAGGAAAEEWEEF